MADAMIVTLAKDELISKTLPGKVQSYMAAGKPIVASIDGEATIVLSEAKCGLFCESENYNYLSIIMKEITKTDLFLLGSNAKKFYNEHFKKSLFFESIERMAQDVAA